MRFHFPIGQLGRLALALGLVLAVFGTNDLHPVQAQGQINLSKFDILNTTSGWILLDQHLFWTSDAGGSWREIRPSLPTDALIQDVRFIDSNNGWVLWTTSNPDSSLNFQLAYTTDNGKTWTAHSLSLFETGELASFAEKAEMGWFDSQSGWISVKQSSGSNFSIGTLFTTSDGGVIWHRFTLPIADKIYFSDPQNGWAVGGPGNDQSFITSDGGATWKRIILTDIADDIQVKVYPPFISNGQSLLITTSLGRENHLNIYSLANSDQLSSTGQLKLDVQPGQLGLSILDSRNFVATVPGTPSIVRMENGKLNVLKNKDGLSASIVSLDMISLESGWAESIDSNCVPASSPDRGSSSVSCSSVTRLLRTDDGGVTWQTINLPSVQSGVASLNAGDTLTSSSLTASGNTALFTGQGFDACEIPTLSQMQTWSASSPYKVVNLYVGGSSRACNNTALIASYIFLLHQQGWDFIPTWVGPQAPCTGFNSRMSSDVTTAYTQGVNEANLAVDRLAQLGLTGPEKTASVIYYDIENYGIDAACRSAVNAFMNGWVSQIRTRGNLAGVYGSTLCNTGLSDFLTITNVPDVIWAARWYHDLGQGYYDPNASVWNLGNCIPNTAWANHQRVRQYEGDHNETWGNLTLEIDSDVLDGVVAIPYDYPYVSSITRKDANPNSTSLVNFTVTFSKAVTGVNAADFRLTTTGVINASISTISGSGTTYNVAVNTGQASGTIRLDVLDNDSIQDAANNSLGGAGTGNGNFSSGETYAITKFVNISGNAGAADVTLSYLNGTVQTVTSDGSGNYSIKVPYGWGGTVTPVRVCYSFTPANRVYSNVVTNQTGQNYSATFNSNCGASVGKYDDTDSHWVYTGTWKTYSGSGPYNNTLHYTVTVGDSAFFPFNGTHFTLSYTQYPNRGSFEVYVDGNKVTTINANGTTAWQKTYTSPTFAAGTHIAQFKNIGGSGTVIDVDAIQVLNSSAPGVGKYDDTDSHWVYAGTWKTYSGSGPYSSTLHYTATVGNSASFQFNGTQFIFSYSQYPNRGSFEVYVDGSKITTINANGTVQWQKTYTSPIFSAATHTAQFKNIGGSGIVIDVDAIEILDTSAPGTGTYDDNDANWTYTGNWKSYNGSGPYNDTLHYTVTVGNTASFPFNGTQFNLRYTQYPNRGSFEVYVDGSKITTINANGTVQWQTTYSSPTFPAGTHVVQIKNIGGSGTVIDVDAIQIN